MFVHRLTPSRLAQSKSSEERLPFREQKTSLISDRVERYAVSRASKFPSDFQKCVKAVEGLCEEFNSFLALLSSPRTGRAYPFQRNLHESIGIDVNNDDDDRKPRESRRYCSTEALLACLHPSVTSFHNMERDACRSGTVECTLARRPTHSGYEAR